MLRVRMQDHRNRRVRLLDVMITSLKPALGAVEDHFGHVVLVSLVALTAVAEGCEISDLAAWVCVETPTVSNSAILDRNTGLSI